MDRLGEISDQRSHSGYECGREGGVTGSLSEAKPSGSVKR